MGSVTPFDVPDTQEWATFLAKTVVACNYRGGWQGAGNDCNVRISAHRNDTAALNAGTFIQGTMEWAVGGTSTLQFQEWAESDAASVTAVPTRDIDAGGGNIKIQGLAVCTTANDAATKAYVDGKVNDMLDLNDPVQTVCDNNITGTTVTYTHAVGTLVIVDVTLTGQFSNPQANAVDCGNFTLNDTTVNKRILFRGSKGAAVNVGNDSDGVYELTAMAGNQATFTRVAGLQPQTEALDKGQFVLVNGNGADDEGNGYVLNADVSDGQQVEPWILFSSQQVINFEPPIVNINGNWTVGGASDGTQEHLPLTAGGGGAGGKASFGATVGKTGTAFAIHGDAITLNDAGTLNVNAATSVTITAPTTTITADTLLKLDATGGDTKIYGDANIFAKVDGGTNPFAAFPTYAQAKVLGCVAPTTSSYAVASAETIGNGILFDTVSDFSGTNSNEGVFYLAPHYAGGSVGDAGCVSLDIMKFANGAGGAGSIIAQLIPP